MRTDYTRPPLPGLASLYAARFGADDLPRKNAIWQVLCSDFFQRYVKADDSVLDLGAGYCEFINQIKCGRKIAVDPNEETVRYAANGVQVVQESSTDMRSVPESSVDVVFASNFFEHLRDKDEFWQTLTEIRRVLAPGGRLLVLQPNIRLLDGAYWDFVDHHLPLTDRTITEALVVLGFDVVEVRARFLPYTTKSLLPQTRWLVKLYLKLRPAQWVLGKQAWIVAVKGKGSADVPIAPRR